MTSAPQLAGNKARRAEAESILSDRLAGASIYDLEQRYQLSSATIYRRMDDALEHRIAPTVDAYRAQQNEVLDRQMVRLEAQVAAADVLITTLSQGGQPFGSGTPSVVETDKLDKALSTRLRAIEAIIRLTDRRAKLNGLDAPQKAEVHVTIETPADIELRELLQRQAETRGIEA